MRTALRVALGLTLAAAAGIAAARLGGLDFITSDGSVGSVAIESIAVWWGLACGAVLLAGAFVTRPREIVLAVVAVAVALCAVEAALRILAVPRAQRQLQSLESSTLHHIYQPNTTLYQGKVEGRDVLIRIGPDGLRSDYTREAFLGYRRRVALLGDSFVFGFGVPQEDACDRVLESELRRLLGDDDVAVLNAGVVSYSPLLSLQLYRKRVAAYHPQLVVLVLDASDIGDDFRYAGEIVSSDGSGVRFDREDQERLPRHVALYEMIRPLAERIGRDLRYPIDVLRRGAPRRYDYYEFEVTVGGVVETNRYFIYRHPLADTRPYFDATLGYIQALAREVERDGGRFILAVAPRYQQWSDRECPDNWEVKRGEYTLDDPCEYAIQEYFHSVEGRVEFPILDLLEAFRRSAEFPLVFGNDPHWNAAGHALVGRTLAARLSSSLAAAAAGPGGSEPK